MSDEDGLKLERQAAARDAISWGAPIDGNRAAPPRRRRRLGRPGRQRRRLQQFLDRRRDRATTVIDGQRRASTLIDPPDGRVPQMTPQARQRFARNIRPTSDQSAREDDPGFEGGGAYDDPERRPLGERCLMGFGSTSGPPVAAELLLQQPPPDRADDAIRC